MDLALKTKAQELNHDKSLIPVAQRPNDRANTMNVFLSRMRQLNQAENETEKNFGPPSIQKWVKKG